MVSKNVDGSAFFWLTWNEYAAEETW